MSGATIIISPAPTARSYFTDFTGTEDPLSEGGAWAQSGLATGLDWTDCRKSGGIAFGTQTGASPPFSDSVAYLGGYGPNHRCGAHIAIRAGAKAAATLGHEVELILRGVMSPHQQSHYECNLGFSNTGDYAQIILLNGTIGSFTVLATYAPPAFVDGDYFEAQISGTVITTYLNGSLIQTYDTAGDAAKLSTGNPGIAFYWNATENVDDFGFTDFDALELP